MRELIENFEKAYVQNDELIRNIHILRDKFENIGELITKTYKYLEDNDIENISQDLLENLKTINDIHNSINRQYRYFGISKKYEESNLLKNDIIEIKNTLFKIENKINKNNLDIEQREYSEHIYGHNCILIEDYLFFINTLDKSNLYVCNQKKSSIIKLTSNICAYNLCLKDNNIFFVDKNSESIMYINCIDNTINQYLLNNEEYKLKCKNYKIYLDMIFTITQEGIFYRKIDDFNEEFLFLCKCDSDYFDIFDDYLFFEKNKLLFKINIRTKKVYQIL